MKYLLTILLLLTAFAVRAQYTPNAGAFQWKGGEFLQSLQIPTGCGSPITLTHAPDPVRAGLYFDSCNNIFYRYNPKTKLWSNITSGGTSGTGGIGAVYNGTGLLKDNDSTLSLDTLYTDARYLPNGLISPGYVTWSGTGLTFNVTDAIYTISGKRHTSPAGSITLDAADATLPRYDVIGVDTLGAIIKITGTASANPVTPQINPASQLALTSIYIPAGATIPGNINQNIIYDENTEGYTVSATGLTADPNSTADFYHGAKSIDATGQGDIFFTLNTGTAKASDFSTLTLFLKSKDPFNGTGHMYITFYNDNTPVSGTDIVTIKKGIGWVNYSFSMSGFFFGTPYFNKLKITFNGISGFVLDYVQLQSGTAPPSIETDPIAINKTITVNGSTQKLNDNPAFTVSGGSRFGIEDNLGIQDRNIDMQGFGLFTSNGSEWNFSADAGSKTVYIDGKVNISLPHLELSVKDDIGNATLNQNFIYPDSTLQYISSTVSGKDIRIVTPTPANGHYYIPLTVNGTRADATGNITVSGGSGGRFGIEDNTGVQDRAINMQYKNFGFNNLQYFNTSLKDSGIAFGTMELAQAGISLTHIDKTTGKDANIFISGSAFGPGNGGVGINGADIISLSSPKIRFIISGGNNSLIPNVSGTDRYLVASVNGNYADGAGDITVSTGGGGLTGSIIANRMAVGRTATSITSNDSIFIDTTRTRMGIGTFPNFALMFDSTRSIVNTISGIARGGIVFNYSNDTSVNYRRVRFGFDNNNTGFYILPEKGGTASLPSVNVMGSQFITNTFTTPFLASNGAQMAGTTSITGTLVIGTVTTGSNVGAQFRGSNALSTGNLMTYDFVPTMGTTGTAGATAVRISPSGIWGGSGANVLFDVGINSANNGTGTHTSYFKVAQSGISTFTNTVNLATGTASTAPLNIPPGVYKSVPANGDIENDGTDLSYTASGVRYKLQKAGAKRVTSITTSATLTPNAATDDGYKVTALASSPTTINSPGTGNLMQELIIRITDDGTARNLNWNAIYRASPDLALPAITTAGKTMYLKFIYNSESSTWDLIGYLSGF